MSSEQQVIISIQDLQDFIVPVRATNKLTLDSQQQQRLEQQERQRQQQIKKRKQQKRRKRQEAERQQLEKLKMQQEKQKKYQQPEMMFEEDSQNGTEFKRVQKKIARMYPQFANKYQGSKKKNNFIVEDHIDDQQSQSDSGSGSDEQSESRHKKEHKQKKIEKKQKKPKEVVQKKPVEKRKVQPQVKKQKIKVQHKGEGKKQHLVREVSVRWWYALPQWPPADFDYEGKLRQLGYRVLDAEKFKLQDDFVNGLEKVMAVYGYRGVYKSKTKLIDVRPKQSAPTLNNFRKMSVEQLSNILKKALTVQISQLKQVKYQQKGEDELMVQLERQLKRLRT